MVPNTWLREISLPYEKTFRKLVKITFKCVCVWGGAMCTGF